MSETQDIIELAEDVVAVDKELRRLIPYRFAAKSWTDATAYSNGGSLGSDPIMEGELIELVGLNLNNDGIIEVVFNNVDATDAEPGHFHVFDVESLMKLDNGLIERLNETVRQTTNWGRFSQLASEVARRLRHKPALQDLMRRHIQEGRRALLEEKAEGDELEAESFYAEQKDYGMF